MSNLSKQSGLRERSGWVALTVVCLGLWTLPSVAQTPIPPQGQAAVAPPAEAIYQAWRVSSVLGDDVRAKGGESLGKLRNVKVDEQGNIESLIVEGNGTTELPEFVFMIPWQKVRAAELPARVVADISDGRQPDYGVMPGTKGVPEPEDEFAVSQIIGDYARLQTGRAFGYVSDVLFSREGKMIAVLVTRNAAIGGGTYAFGFPGISSRNWNPGLSYYGLPFVTDQQALEAARKIELARFK